MYDPCLDALDVTRPLNVLSSKAEDSSTEICSAIRGTTSLPRDLIWDCKVLQNATVAYVNPHLARATLLQVKRL